MVHSFSSHPDILLHLIERRGNPVLEPPKGDGLPVMRVFVDLGDAIVYQATDSFPEETGIRSLPLPDLWTLVGGIDAASMRKYNKHVCIALSTYVDGELCVSEILRSGLAGSN